jgi:hypothetical protein
MAPTPRRVWTRLHYIKGKNNIVTDALSWLGMIKEPITESLPLESAATLFAWDKMEFDFPSDFPLTYAEIEYRQKQDACYIKRRLSKKATLYKGTEFPFGDITYKLITKEDK